MGKYVHTIDVGLTAGTRMASVQKDSWIQATGVEHESSVLGALIEAPPRARYGQWRVTSKRL